MVEATSASMVSLLARWCLPQAGQSDIPIERLSISTCTRPRVTLTQGDGTAQRVDPTKRRTDCTPIEPLSIKHPNAAGIDIGGRSHYAAVPSDRVGKDGHAVREFGPHTENLVAVADWLCACRIDTAALESTGVYWIALYELLQARLRRVAGRCQERASRQGAQIGCARLPMVAAIAQLWAAVRGTSSK